jgi:integrase
MSTTYEAPSWLPDWISIAADGRVSWYEGMARGAGKRRQERKRTVELAEKYARQLMSTAKRTAGLNVDLGATWTELCQSWFDAHDGVIPEGTLRRRQSAINAWLLPHIGQVPLAETRLATLLTVADVAVKSLGRSGFDSTIQSMTSIAAWGWERQWLPAGALGTDDERRLALRSVRRRLKADATVKAASDGDEDRGVTIDVVPTWEEVCALAEAVTDRVGGRAKSRATGEQYGRAVRIAAGSGLRLCELLGLTVEQISLGTGIIAVNHQLDRYTAWDGTGPMPTVDPKYGRKRQVGVWEKVKADVEASVDAASAGVLFPPFGAQAWWADAWGRLLAAAREDASWQWPPHWLRHHYGSYSLTPREHGGLGLPGATVQTYLGHKNLKTTLETYIQPVTAPAGWLT